MKRNKPMPGRPRGTDKDFWDRMVAKIKKVPDRPTIFMGGEAGNRWVLMAMLYASCHANIQCKVAEPDAQTERIVDSMIDFTSKAVASMEYVNALRGKAKQRYAYEYYNYLDACNRRDGSLPPPEPPKCKGVPAKVTQAIRLHLDSIMSKNQVA